MDRCEILGAGAKRLVALVAVAMMMVVGGAWAQALDRICGDCVAENTLNRPAPASGPTRPTAMLFSDFETSLNDFYGTTFGTEWHRYDNQSEALYKWNSLDAPIPFVRGGTGGNNGTNGMAATITLTADDVHFFTTFTAAGSAFNARNAEFTGIYLEYKTPGDDMLHVRLLESTAEDPYDNFIVSLPGTRGNWHSAWINFDRFVYNSANGGNPDRNNDKIDAALLAKLWLSYIKMGDGTGFVAIDNVYFIDDSHTPSNFCHSCVSAAINPGDPNPNNRDVMRMLASGTILMLTGGGDPTLTNMYTSWFTYKDDAGQNSTITSDPNPVFAGGSNRAASMDFTFGATTSAQAAPFVGMGIMTGQIEGVGADADVTGFAASVYDIGGFYFEYRTKNVDSLYVQVPDVITIKSGGDYHRIRIPPNNPAGNGNWAHSEDGWKGATVRFDQLARDGWASGLGFPTSVPFDPNQIVQLDIQARGKDGAQGNLEIRQVHFVSARGGDISRITLPKTMNFAEIEFPEGLEYDFRGEGDVIRPRIAVSYVSPYLDCDNFGRCTVNKVPITSGYTVEYFNNTAPGTGQVKVKMGDDTQREYFGAKTATFRIFGGPGSHEVDIGNPPNSVLFSDFTKKAEQGGITSFFTEMSSPWSRSFSSSVPAGTNEARMSFAIHASSPFVFRTDIYGYNAEAGGVDAVYFEYATSHNVHGLTFRVFDTEMMDIFDRNDGTNPGSYSVVLSPTGGDNTWKAAQVPFSALSTRGDSRTPTLPPKAGLDLSSLASIEFFYVDDAAIMNFPLGVNGYGEVAIRNVRLVGTGSAPVTPFPQHIGWTSEIVLPPHGDGTGGTYNYIADQAPTTKTPLPTAVNYWGYQSLNSQPTNPVATLAAGTDYTISYANNTAVGTATATLTPIYAAGKYIGRPITQNFTILAHDGTYALSVTSSVGKISIAGNETATAEYPAGASVALAITEIPVNKRLKQWIVTPASLALATNAQSFTVVEAAFIMPAENVSIEAEFVDLFQVSVNFGTISSAGGAVYYAEGETVSVTAGAPPASMRFKEWSIIPGSVTFTAGTSAASSSASFLMPAEGVAVVAVYELIPHSVTYGVTGGDNGTLTAKVGDDDVSSGNNVGQTRTVTFYAIPSQHYRVKQWTVDGIPVAGNTTNTYEHEVGEDVTVEVEFELVNYTVHFGVTSGSEDWGTLTAAGKSTDFTIEFTALQSVDFVATPVSQYYVITGWSVSQGIDLSGDDTDATRSILSLTSNVTVMVTFGPDNQAIVDALVANLDWDKIAGRNVGNDPNDNSAYGEDNVRRRLNLLTDLSEIAGIDDDAIPVDGVTISWASDNAIIDHVTGRVDRPITAGETTVTLTATITKSPVTEDVVFIVTVQHAAPEEKDVAVVEEAILDVLDDLENLDPDGLDLLNAIFSDGAGGGGEGTIFEIKEIEDQDGDEESKLVIAIVVNEGEGFTLPSSSNDLPGFSSGSGDGEGGDVEIEWEEVDNGGGAISLGNDNVITVNKRPAYYEPPVEVKVRARISKRAGSSSPAPAPQPFEAFLELVFMIWPEDAPIFSDIINTPTISGTAQVDQTLTADYTRKDGKTIPGGSVITYEWKAGGTQVKKGSGTGANNYKIAAADVGKTITVTLTWQWEDTPVTSAATAAVTASTACTHNFSILVPISAATCTSPGTGNYKCSLCGEVNSAVVAIDALGHSIGAWVTTPATCALPGHTTRRCSRPGCTHSETQNPTLALGHVLGSWSAPTAATCELPGQSTRNCTRPGCTHSESQTASAALGHTLGSWETVTPATCVLAGQRRRTCSRPNCAHIDIGAIAVLGHTYGSATTTVSPTCLLPGESKRTCTRSNCAHIDIGAIAALGHTWGSWVITQSPTARSEGIRMRTCQRDPSHTEAEILSAVTSISVGDQVVPGDIVDEAVIAPSRMLSANLTAGPNPVCRGGNLPPAVNFYWQGRVVDDGVLVIYDALGNVVNKINIADDASRRGVARNALTAELPGSRRIIGTWDLKDNKGQQVSEGTYLVRGVINGKDGTLERVSIVIGVR